MMIETCVCCTLNQSTKETTLFMYPPIQHRNSIPAPREAIARNEPRSQKYVTSAAAAGAPAAGTGDQVPGEWGEKGGGGVLANAGSD